MKKIPLHTKIILGLIFGFVVGVISVFLGIGDIISNWIMPFGTIFVKMLKLIAVPLILVSLVSGISNLKDTAKLYDACSEMLSHEDLTPLVNEKDLNEISQKIISNVEEKASAKLRS